MQGVPKKRPNPEPKQPKKHPTQKISPDISAKLEHAATSPDKKHFITQILRNLLSTSFFIQTTSFFVQSE